MRKRLAAIAVVACAAMAMLAPSAAWPQSARAVKLVVPYPPGGGADVLARVVADAIGKLQGPAMVVENRPGAGTVIGTQDVARAVPDGNTLLFTNNALLLVPHIRKVDYDPFSSLSSICKIATTPTIVVVNNASPYRTLGDLIGAARAKPGELTFGAFPGALSQVTWEMFLHRANIQMTLVPFNGTLPQVNALLGQQIDAAIIEYPTVEGLLKSDKLRVLASTSAARVDWLPDVPTIAELGYKDFEIELWYGAFAPAHTPQQIIAKFTDWFAKAAQAPQVRSKLLTDGIETSAVCGAPFVAYLQKRFDEYGQVIREANIKAD